MAEVNVTLSLRRRQWFAAALTVLVIGCAILSLLSDAAADWLSDKGTGFLARHGFIYEVI
ncbi:MAG: hypothetical protein CMN63_06895 [Sphingobium sp.]|nr:hypothetical protein [Sphingobium sp.]|tara:strand:- start:402 stop:581 length:180 start_codon:yes stop_codon:yes gene_type:complete